MSRLARRLQQATAAPTQMDADPLASLDRVAWHGGPAYFAAYDNPGLLADTEQVPLFEWYGNVDNSSVAAEKATGVNGFLKVTGSTDLGVVRAAGLVAIPGYGEYSGTPGNETVGWHGDDESDMNFGPGWDSGQGFNHLQSVEANFPTDNRVAHNNFGKGILYWESESDAATFVNGGDATGNWRQGMVSADLYWYAGIQSLSYDGVHYLRRGTDQIARAQNYGWMIDRQRHLQNVGSYNTGPKPIYAFVETSHPYTTGSMPTPDQVEGAVWNSFIHEAAGIFYFHHSFIDDFAAWDAATQYQLGDNVAYNGSNYCAANLITPTLGQVPTNDPAWVGPVDGSSVGLRNPMVPGMTDKLADLSNRIQALASVINSQSRVWTFNTDLETMLKVPGDGCAYIFAMQTIQHTSGTYTFTLPAGIKTTHVSVVNESRSLTSSYGTYSKTFVYTGTVQSWTVPAGVTSITVDLYGSEGGSMGTAVPGRGGYVQATIPVTPGETLQINVGGKGGTVGGWNGGGTSADGASSGNAGGGGASDIRRGGTALSNRILVAGGGGGTSVYGEYGAGGNGGGLVGAAGAGDGPGAGGSQSAGGGSGNGGADGMLGVGGSSSSGGGGGGGYYGGGSGGWYHGGGGGGSSYIDPSATDVTNTQGVQPGDGVITISANQIPAENLTFSDSFAAEYSCHIYKITL